MTLSSEPVNRPFEAADNPRTNPQHDSRPLSKLRRRSILIPLVAFGIVALATVAATSVSKQAIDNKIDRELVFQADTLVASIQAGIEAINLRLVAVEALFQGSEAVTADEYASFVHDLEPTAGMGGIAYMPVVDARNLAAFEDGVGETIPSFQVFEINKHGDRVAVAVRDTYFPVQFFEPSDSLQRPLGLDAASPPGRLPFLVKALASEGTISTPPLPLATTGQQGFLLFRPISDAQGTTKGLVCAPVVLFDLAAAQVPDALAKTLDWTIRDVTEQVPESASPGSLDRHTPLLAPIGDRMVHTEVIAVADRIWQIDVNPAAASPLLDDRYETHWILVVGLIAALLTGFAVHSFSSKWEKAREITSLKEIVRAKDQFLATVSHELRTPLTSVVGFSELLRDQGSELSTHEQSELVAIIAGEASDLAVMIEDLLTLEKAEHGRLTVLAEPVNVRGQTALVLEALDLADRIHVEPIQPPFVAVADPRRVRQIIRNLVTNAVAYGGPKTRIRIEPVGEQLAIAVIDDGAGIPAEHVERIFAPYHRAHSSGGTTASMGLGLYVSRTLAQRMGGDVTYHRTDGMTHFQLTLPLKPPQDYDHWSSNPMSDSRPVGSALKSALVGEPEDMALMSSEPFLHQDWAAAESVEGEDLLESLAPTNPSSN